MSRVEAAVRAIACARKIAAVAEHRVVAIYTAAVAVEKLAVSLSVEWDVRVQDDVEGVMTIENIAAAAAAAAAAAVDSGT